MAREKILIVCPDHAICGNITECLSARYEVLSSDNFDQALDRYREESFHTVITNIEEGAEAVEVITKLQKSAEETPVIVITTHNSVPMAVEALKTPVLEFTPRPFNHDELKLVVRHALERKKLQEEIKEKMYFQEMTLIDSLTQVYNRRYFDELLQREEWRAKRYPQKFSLMKIDVDDFKKFNDYYGRPAGDKVLGMLGVMLRSRIRNTDSVSRFAGQEFAVITPHTDKQNAMILASRLHDAIGAEQFLVDGFRSKVTVSIGLATFNEDSFTKDELIKNSDLALKQAKRLGKNRVCLFGSGGR